MTRFKLQILAFTTSPSITSKQVVDKAVLWSERQTAVLGSVCDFQLLWTGLPRVPTFPAKGQDQSPLRFPPAPTFLLLLRIPEREFVFHSTISTSFLFSFLANIF